MSRPEESEASAEKIASFDRMNRNKEMVVINLRRVEGRDIFYRLAKRADVSIEGFRPGVMKRLAADYKTLREINPRLIYCSQSGVRA